MKCRRFPFQTYDIKVLNALSEIIYGETISEQLCNRKIYNYLSRYDYIFDKEYVHNEKSSNNEQGIDNQAVWVCWFQGWNAAPELVHSCIKSIHRNIPDKKIILITDENLDEYLKVPSFILKKRKQGIISNTHYSDIIRIMLLFEYGGTWIDATVFCSGAIPSYMYDEELFFFQNSLLRKSLYKGSSWWISARKGNKVIALTREMILEYWKNEKKLIDYYLFHLILSRVIDRVEKVSNVRDKMVYVENSAPHILQGKLNKRYRMQEWEVLKANSPVHKLTYKGRRGGKGSYYAFVRNDCRSE